VRRVLLTGLLLLAVALGVGGGYLTGDYLDRPLPTTSGEASPLGEPATPTPSEPTLPVKTPIPSDVPALETGLDYERHNFTVTPKGQQPVQLSIKVPDDWRLTRNPKAPGEVKFLDRLNERGVRVEAVEPATQTPAEARAQLVVGLKQSQPPENDLRIISQTDEKVEADDGTTRNVSTLIYTYIPFETVRYVIVRWVATGDDDLTSVEMSITGLPQDAKGLAEVLTAATSSVRETG
jgi:hypothetical protein